MSQPSLFKRLVFSVLLMSFLLWCAVLAALIYQTKKIPRYFSSIQLESTAQQQLAAVNAIQNAHAISRYAANNDVIQQQLYKKLSVFVAQYHLQIWQGDQLIYSIDDLPIEKPQPSDFGKLTHVNTLANHTPWLAWTEADAQTQFTVRALQERPLGFSPTFRTAGFYLIPFLVSVPFLFFPIWWAISRGLKPLNQVAADIIARAPNDLSPLPQSPYKELDPLVSAINRLMEKIKVHLTREQEFLHDAAHELKTPLAVIQLNCELLETAIEPATKFNALDGIKKGVIRATRSTHQLLASARTDYGQQVTSLKTQINLTQLLQDRLAYWSGVARQKSIEIALASDSNLTIQGNLSNITLLIDNLIDNAIKYSPEKSTIEVSLQKNGGTICLEFIDQGIGIPSELRGKVFDRFFRINPSENYGTGLGLSIVKRVIDELAAHIEITNNPNSPQGTLVRISFT